MAVGAVRTPSNEAIYVESKALDYETAALHLSYVGTAWAKNTSAGV
jgi:hypothetical protein